MRVLVFSKSLCGYVSNQVQYNMERLLNIYDRADIYIIYIYYHYICISTGFGIK